MKYLLECACSPAQLIFIRFYGVIILAGVFLFHLMDLLVTMYSVDGIVSCCVNFYDFCKQMVVNLEKYEFRNLMKKHKTDQTRLCTSSKQNASSNEPIISPKFQFQNL